MIEVNNDLLFQDEDHKRRYEEDPNSFIMYVLHFSEDMQTIRGGEREDTGEKMTIDMLVEVARRLRKDLDWENL